MEVQIPTLSGYMTHNMQSDFETMELVGRASVLLDAVQKIQAADKHPAFVRFSLTGGKGDCVNICVFLADHLEIICNNSPLDVVEIDGGDVVVPGVPT